MIRFLANDLKKAKVLSGVHKTRRTSSNFNRTNNRFLIELIDIDRL